MRNRTMLEGPLLSNIITYTIPIILTGFLQLLFNAADLIIVGRYCGELSVAAVGNCGSLSMLIINLFIGLSVGTTVTVAHAIGAGNREKVSHTVHTAVPTAIVSGIIVAIIGVCGNKTFLTMMGTPDTVLPLSSLYMKIYFMGMPFIMVYNFCASILRATGDTKTPLFLLALSGVINVGLNVIFVTQFDMNVAGVALATTISQGISALLVIVALMKRTDSCRLILSNMRFYKPQLLKIIRIGLPSGIQGSLFSISNVIIQSSINSFGGIVMSGNAAAANIDGFLYVILNAFHQTALNYISQNNGARQFDRIKRILGICLGCVVVVGITVSSAAYFMGPTLLSFYIPNSAEAIQWGMVRLTFLCIPYFLCGLMDVSTGALRGMGASVAPMIISVLGVCGIRIGWIYSIFQMPKFHTPQCLYASYTISWTATFLCQMIAFFLIYRKRVKST
ncbi:MAG: MATE family efflux transporter [Anaerotignum sp.]|nr:MATE family efflux transporter [Anaerotignum sp.]